jgi:serine/threonine-protein kinase
VSAGLDAIVLKCLKRRPEERFQTARELIDALTPFAQAGYHGATAFLQQSPYQPSPVTPTGPHAPPGFGVTPAPGRPTPPHPGAVTGGGSAPRGIPGQPGTVALASTPAGGGMHHPGYPGASTNSSWQAEQSLPTHKPPYALLAVGAAVLVVAAVAGGIMATRSKDPTVDPAAASSAPASAGIDAPVASLSPSPSPTDTETAPPASASARAAAVVATAHAVQPAGHHVSVPPKPQTVVVKPADPAPKPADPPPKPAPTPAASTKPAQGGVQTTR